MLIFIYPSIEEIGNQNTSENEKFSLSENNFLEVSADYKSKKYKHKKVKKAYKHKKYKKHKHRKIKYKYKRSSHKYKRVNGNPKISSKQVVANAKCSCSLYKNYNIHNGKWENYCPYCNKHGTLSYTNMQGCPEGMFYCDMHKGGCDADFCIVHGKAHTYRHSKYLIRA